MLKEISNDSRVYVHRSGFDPPPLKEEKRMSGDLSEIRNSSTENSIVKEKSFPGIRNATLLLEKMVQEKNPVINSSEKMILEKAGNEIAGLAVEQPGKYLASLSLLKSLLTNDLEPQKIKPALKNIQYTFWSVLPVETASPSARQSTMHSLDAQFFQQLDVIKYGR